MIPKDGRLQGDGSIVFPYRGVPPPCTEEGYMEDPNDPYKWIMVYCSCKHRILNQRYRCTNGVMRNRDYCALKQMQINPRFCNQDCQVEDR